MGEIESAIVGFSKSLMASIVVLMFALVVLVKVSSKMRNFGVVLDGCVERLLMGASAETALSRVFLQGS